MRLPPAALVTALLAGGVPACGDPAAGGPRESPPTPVAADPSRAILADALRAARTAEGAGDAGAAEAAWKTVLALDAANPGALYASARLLARRGDAAGALRRIESLRLVEPNAGRGLLLRAEILTDPASGAPRDPVLAVDAAAEALALNPEESGPHLVLGRALLRAGRATEGARRLATAARMNPRDAESRSLLGVVRLRDGDGRGARTAFHDALAAAAPAGAAAGTEAPGGVPGEGDTRESLAGDRAPTAGELRAVAGLALLGVPVDGTEVARDPPAAGVHDALRAALDRGGTGEAIADLDGDGAADAAAVEAGGRLALAIRAAGRVRVHGPGR